eukprot:gene9750-11386_t
MSTPMKSVSFLNVAIMDEISSAIHALPTDIASHRPSEVEKIAHGKAITARREEVKEIFKALRMSEVVDLAFLLDCTGSMQPHIDQVKRDIASVQDNLSKRFANLDLRFAFVRYTDMDMGASRTTSLDFTNSTPTFVGFVNNIIANGGGDTPEDVFGGLQAVFNLNWRQSSTKVLIHIADAPCHGIMYHSFGGDSYPNGYPEGVTHHQLMASISSNELSIGSFSAKDTSTLGDRIFTNVSKTVMTRATHMTSAICSPGASRSHIMDPSVPDWTRVMVKTFSEPASLKECLDYAYKLRMEEERMVIKMAPSPFAKGGCRLAFYALDVSTGKRIVLKQSIRLGGKNNSLKRYLEYMEIQTVSAKFAEEFNKVIGWKAIQFIPAKVIELPDKTFLGLEEYIPGDYRKYSNNTGWFDDTVEPMLQTFSHWTYVASKNTTMVVDLQGVKVSGGLLLTDPAIHSVTSHRFGVTNLDSAGMKRFFDTHTVRA